MPTITYPHPLPENSGPLSVFPDNYPYCLANSREAVQGPVFSPTLSHLNPYEVLCCLLVAAVLTNPHMLQYNVMNVVLWCTIVASVSTTGYGYYSEPICNPTLGYCAKFFNMTKLPNKFNEDNYTRVFSKFDTMLSFFFTSFVQT